MKRRANTTTSGRYVIQAGNKAFIDQVTARLVEDEIEFEVNVLDQHHWIAFVTKRPMIADCIVIRFGKYIEGRGWGSYCRGVGSK